MKIINLKNKGCQFDSIHIGFRYVNEMEAEQLDIQSWNSKYPTGIKTLLVNNDNNEIISLKRIPWHKKATICFIGTVDNDISKRQKLCSGISFCHPKDLYVIGFNKFKGKKHALQKALESNEGKELFDKEIRSEIWKQFLSLSKK